MKRPIVVAVIGYIIGIIWGLYIQVSIVLFYTFISLCIIIKKNIYHFTLNNKFLKEKKRKFKFFSLSRFFRYVKLFFNRKIIITLIIFSIMSNTIILFKNQKYDNLYKETENLEIIGIIQELQKENHYKKVYKLKVIEVKDLEHTTNTYLYINVKTKLQFGDIVRLNGKFLAPNDARNYGGFNQKKYYKTLNIYGTVNVENIKIVSNITDRLKDRNIEYIFDNINKCFYSIKDKIKETTSKYLDNEIYPIYLGLILGDTSQIDEQTKEQFKDSNLSHILAISGMHISYIILGITILLSKTLGKRKSKIITILLLIIYIFITGFTPSIMRASIMGIMVMLGSLLHKNSDIWTTISISLFIILVYNPYLIGSISLQYTYAGTIGILLFRNNILQILNNGKESKSKIKEVISISLSAQTLILPLTLYHFNTFGIYFLLTNLLISFIIGPIIVLSFIFLFLLFIDLRIMNFVSIILNLSIKLILIITNIGYLPFSKIYIRTPKVLEILIFLLIVVIWNFIYSAKHKQNPNFTDLRIKYILDIVKYRFMEMKRALIFKKKEDGLNIIGRDKRRYIKNYKIFFIIVVFCISLIIGINNSKKLKIHFVDVGQGDCTFIETPNNKTILIDGGGSEFGDFDVGKSTLLPYILDRGYTKIDYMIISHFDSDHVGRITNYYAGTRGRNSSHFKARV